MRNIEILDTVFGKIIEEVERSRNSGIDISDHKKFCGGPEILDQYFRFDRNAVPFREIPETVFGIITKETERSSNSRNFVWDHK